MSKQYFYYVNGEPVEVSQEVYGELIQSDNKMRYFEYDLKTEKALRKNGYEKVRPSREDSLDRLINEGFQFSDSSQDTEEAALHRITLALLIRSLSMLSAEEHELIKALFFDEYSEREWSARSGIPQKTINDRKRRILAKLKKLLHG